MEHAVFLGILCGDFVLCVELSNTKLKDLYNFWFVLLLGHVLLPFVSE